VHRLGHLVQCIGWATLEIVIVAEAVSSARYLLETRANDRRAAFAPEVLTKLTAAGFDVIVQSGAGEHAWGHR